MNKNLKKFYIIEIIITLFIIFMSFVLFFTENLIKYENYITNGFWITLLVSMMTMFHLAKDKNYYKDTTSRLVFICLLTALIILYSLGFFTGFTKSIYSHTLRSMLNNVLPVIITIITQEIIRYIIAKNTQKNIKIIAILTTLFIILEIIVGIRYYNFYDNEQIFIFIFSILVPIIANQMVYSYLTFNISILPTLMLRLALELYQFAFPIYPAISIYIISVFRLAIPFAIYYFTYKNLKYNEKGEIGKNEYYSKIWKKILFVPTISILIVIVVLVSGLFTYKMIAIGSNSMVPVYYRGDAIIYEQIPQDKVLEKVKAGDILVFQSGKTVITHRIMKIKNTNGQTFYTTKGDNNEKEDRFKAEKKDVLGVVKLRIKYIGYPTIWLYEKFLNKN